MWVWQSTFEMLSMPIVHRFRNCVIWGAGCLCSPTFQFACQGFRAALMASPRIPLRSLPVIQAKAGVLPKRSSSSTRCALCIETGTKRLGTRGNGWIGSLAENENWEKTLYKNDVTFKSTNPNDSSNQYDLFSRSGLGALQFWIRRINASLDPFLPMWPYHSRILYSKWFCRLELQKVSPKFMESSDPWDSNQWFLADKKTYQDGLQWNGHGLCHDCERIYSAEGTDEFMAGCW